MKFYPSDSTPTSRPKHDSVRPTTSVISTGARRLLVMRSGETPASLRLALVLGQVDDQVIHASAKRQIH
jgi:hypothetical protein